MLQGKKTYLVGIGAVLAAIGGYLTGTIDLAAGIQAIIGAIMAMTIRNGIKTGA